MYTLLELESKTFGELKKIGYELNVLPADDRRRRQSWIDALVNVNPPLLQLLEVSPAAPVEQVQEPTIETVDASPGVEADQHQEPPIEVQAQEAIEGCLDINELWELDQPDCPACGGIDSLNARWFTTGV
jgi:hypothetical protein